MNAGIVTIFPYAYNKDGSIKGPDVDVAKIIGNKLKIDISLVGGQSPNTLVQQVCLINLLHLIVVYFIIYYKFNSVVQQDDASWLRTTYNEFQEISINGFQLPSF